MDLITPLIELFSVAVLTFLLILASKAVRNFGQSKQAVVESASLLGVIVGALTTRVEAFESVVATLQHAVERVSQRSEELEDEQSSLRGRYQQLLEHLQESLSNDRRLVLELEQLKVKLATTPEHSRAVDSMQRPTPIRPIHGSSNATNDPLAPLTPTERHTLEILAREGPKAAPDLGRRMRKSREHMARLMKKLYLEGYVDRESNHAPFRYKLSERIGSILQSNESTTEEVVGKV